MSTLCHYTHLTHTHKIAVRGRYELVKVFCGHNHFIVIYDT